LIKEKIKERIKEKIRGEISEALKPNKDNTLTGFFIDQKGGSIPVLLVALFPCFWWLYSRAFGGSIPVSGGSIPVSWWLYSR
jgi:hypothetical protein